MTDISSPAYSWWTATNNWLIEKANAHFSAWVESKEGAKWRKSRNKSPYHFGYRQPDWMSELRDALGRNDEVMCKRIKLDNL